MTVPTIKTRVTYLEMMRPALLPPVRLSPTSTLLRSRHISPDFYCYLQTVVGEPWLWWSRRAKSRNDLISIIHDSRVDIRILYIDGQPAAFFELDRRGNDSNCEIVFFGLVPSFIGKKLGEALMSALINIAWSYPIKRLWLHSCDLDHPRALQFYRSQGFLPFKEEFEEFPDPRLTGVLPKTAGASSPSLSPLQD